MGYYGLRILVLGGEDNSFFNFVIHPVALVRTEMVMQMSLSFPFL